MRRQESPMHPQLQKDLPSKGIMLLLSIGRRFSQGKQIHKQNSGPRPNARDQQEAMCRNFSDGQTENGRESVFVSFALSGADAMARHRMPLGFGGSTNKRQ